MVGNHIGLKMEKSATNKRKNQPFMKFFLTPHVPLGLGAASFEKKN